MTEQRIHVVQGDYHVSADPQVLLTTTLGSCIAACIRDPVAQVGGMNHFLLPGDEGENASASMRYGAFAMERLVNEILKAGGVRRRLEAKLFGGGRLTEHRVDVGAKNAEFAANFLKREGIRAEPGSLGGEHARRIQFWPASGRARQMMLARSVEAVPRRAAAPNRLEGLGELELF